MAAACLDGVVDAEGGRVEDILLRNERGCRAAAERVAGREAGGCRLKPGGQA